MEILISLGSLLVSTELIQESENEPYLSIMSFNINLD
ncbi:hypothetical protein DSL99_3908 [Leeuwenhoekiella marinoflava]|uniref:Uncharacterized protein n=1 Tax=Leeuwenhoekiella marinoflava TaxID=988 RepID=A0A4Q0PB36_9FLAO|nr:hypothetical protein DSL99_3908 [Leeuwenhoekiella marinoflava]